MPITPEIAIIGLLLALFAGFCWGWKQCEEKFRREEEMRETWRQIEARAAKPVEKPE